MFPDAYFKGCSEIEHKLDIEFTSETLDIFNEIYCGNSGENIS